MGFIKNFVNTGYVAQNDVEPNFCEYTEVFGKSPVLISCDLAFNDMLPASAYTCCLKIQMDVYVQPQLPTLISESEASYVAMVRSSISEHIGGRFVGQCIMGSSGTAYLMFYIPERQAQYCKKMLTEVFMGSFRHVVTDIKVDPEGTQYKKYLYPNEIEIRRSSNARMLKSLRTYGDNGTIPRPVTFTLVLPSKKEALALYSDSMEKGFQYKDVEQLPVEEGMVLPKYKLTIVKEIPFNLDLLQMIDAYLVKLAEKHEGEYKSLETEIVE